VYIELQPGDPDIEAVLSRNLDEQLIERLIDAIRQSGAIQLAMDEARQSVERAVEALSSMPTGVERQALEDLARYIVQREL